MESQGERIVTLIQRNQFLEQSLLRKQEQKSLDEQSGDDDDSKKRNTTATLGGLATVLKKLKRTGLSEDERKLLQKLEGITPDADNEEIEENSKEDEDSERPIDKEQAELGKLERKTSGWIEGDPVEDQFNPKTKFHMVLKENFRLAKRKWLFSDGGLVYLT